MELPERWRLIFASHLAGFSYADIMVTLFNHDNFFGQLININISERI